MVGGMNSKTKHQNTTNRTLKIELAGDMFRRNTFPKIRLQGKWLEQPGFKPNDRVEIIPVAPGIMTLRSISVKRVTASPETRGPEAGRTTKIKSPAPKTYPARTLTRLHLNETTIEIWHNPG